MDKNSIYKTFQEIFRQIPVIILGSGPSCGAGIPGMETLSEHLLEKLGNNINDKWRDISDDLRKNGDLEKALNRTMPDEQLIKELIKTVGDYISNRDRKVRDRYFNRQMTIPVERLINYYRSENLTIITPNYDCLVEYCCDELKIHCNTGFVGYFRKTLDFEKAEREVEYVDRSVVVKGKRRQIAKRTPHIKLFKVHGSIDWYDFNNNTISDTSLINNGKYANKRLIILPGDRKYSETIHAPYRELIQKADNSLRSGRSFLMIGYGFNDEHIQEILVKRLVEDEKPGIIITKELSEKAKELLSACPNLWGVSQKNSSTVICNMEDEYEMSDIELWRIDKFVRDVLGG
jgi:signal peptidase I